jgi:carbamoyltransferase
MITLGISRVHNSAVSLFVDDNLIFHLENERLSNIKYDRYPFLAISKITEYVDHIDNLVIAGVSPLTPVESFDDLDVYSAMVINLGKSFADHGFNRYDFWDQHHKLHAACAFYNSGFKDALCIIKDGMGSDVFLNEEYFLPGTVGRENGTCFISSYPDTFEIVDKHICVNFDLPHSPFYINKNTYLTNTFSEGLAFQKTAKHFGFNELDAGKVMGMASFGKKNVHPIYKDRFINHELFKFKNNDLRNGYLNLPQFDNFNDQCDFAYSLQTEIQDNVVDFILKKLKETGQKNLCLSGGFFLNCVTNYELAKRLPNDINLYIDPISSDAGTSIGGAKLVIKKLMPAVKKKSTLYLGPKYNYNDETLKKLCKNNTTKVVEPVDVAKILSDKKIVAIFQGGSEAGPRALGNRSILYDPRDPNGKDIVNTVKNREWFRPFAGTILHEYVDQWFDLKNLKETPWMMFAVDIVKNKSTLIPAISHVDNTCRVQTLTKDQNNNFYNLIQEFFKITGIPILLNTSFNLAGDCIVETLDSAINTLNRSKIDYLYLPEYKLLIGKDVV